jgi:hypothetical protein
MKELYHTLLRTFLLVIISLSFTGCLTHGITFKYSNLSDPYRIDNFPTPAHNRNIEILFEAETPPDTTYIKTHFFDVHSYYGNTYASLIREIKKHAQNVHVDAVIILTPERSDASTFLAGVGIKFKNRVDYLTEYRLVDQLYIYNHDEKEYKLIANLYSDFDNQIFETENLGEDSLGAFYYKNFIRKYSVPFLLENKSKYWGYKGPFNGMESKRIYHNPISNENIRVTPVYNKQNKVDKFKVKFKYWFSNKPNEKYTVELIYNEQGKLSVKKIYNHHGKHILTEEFSYDEEGKLFTSEYFQINDNQEIPLLKTNYYYFYPEDVYTYF